MATEEELAVARANSEGEDDTRLKEAVEKDKRKEKRKKRLLKEAEKADRRDPAAQVRRKKSGGFRGQEFSEGWVEFTDKKVAKRVARMLNGEQIGGRKRSSFYYDLWNIKYLSKFKWDDLTEEIAYKNAIREQKLALELSAAKRERDFYLSKVDQSKALSKIEERLKKKQKVDVLPKVMRQFPQKKPVVNETGENKAQLSRDILAGVFGGSS
ncbi:UNVERIFIED_CONTAM: Activator of basal transcription 1 [Sesamum radiatum]|uniref:Activator of basal transcription 1 n=1 Tax=Sesamum radiatum TaxID=300843 RepID=A0AAW2P4R9_SESRA